MYQQIETNILEKFIITYLKSDDESAVFYTFP